ncbi:MAG TPA: peptidoglycan-binding protein [Gammaproteobacteria bacterium]|nr:peptidoglycan-binding protein [Gammaproteobacteria bacterium]
MRTEDAGKGRLGRWTTLAVAVLVVLAGLGPAAAAPDPVEVAETIRRSVEQLRSTGEVTVAGRKLRSARTLPEVYEARGFTLLWRDRVSEEALLGEIAAISGEGLDPGDYHFEALRAALDRRRQQADSAAAAATADLLLTDALLRVAAHLHQGKVDPATGSPRWDLLGPVRGESGAALATRIASSGAVGLQLAELRPVQPMYGRLRSALARYRVIEQQGGWEPLASGRVLQAGLEDPRVPALRRRLAATGDFTGIVVDSPRFDGALEEAVRRFQSRHGLEPDGIFGPASLRVLNVPLKVRQDQLRANLERARWLLVDVRGRFLLADPAGRRVVLMDNSEPVFRVAAEFSTAARAVPPFRAELRYLVANPDWVLTPGLVETQVAPLARRAPEQLSARGLQVFNAAGDALDAAAVDWSAPGGVIVRQLPGERSFLGNLRFPIHNHAGVFLHGGPARGEALAGSVRLADAAGLAHALAAGPTASSAESLAAALAAGTPRTLSLATPVPVLYGSWTAWVQADGTVSFRAGYEDRDAAIIAALGRGADRR